MVNWNVSWSDKQRPLIKAFDNARASGGAMLAAFFGSDEAPWSEKTSNIVLHHALRQADLAGAQAAYAFLQAQGHEISMHDPKTGNFIYHEISWQRGFLPGNPERFIADWLIEPEELNHPILALFDRDGDVEAQNNERLIHTAIEMGNLELFDWALSHGANPEGCDDDEENDCPDELPLAMAARMGRPQMVAKLLKAGADPTGVIVSAAGKELHKSPLPAAIASGEWECAKLISSASSAARAEWGDPAILPLVDAQSPTRSPVSSADAARLWVSARASVALRTSAHDAEAEQRKIDDNRRRACSLEAEALALEAKAELLNPSPAAPRAENDASQPSPLRGAPENPAPTQSFLRRLFGPSGEKTAQARRAATDPAQAARDIREAISELIKEADELFEKQLANQLDTAIARADPVGAVAAMKEISAVCERLDITVEGGLPLAFRATALALAAFDSPHLHGREEALTLSRAGRPVESAHGLSRGSRLAVLRACAQFDGAAGDAFRAQLKEPLPVADGFSCAHFAALFNAPAVLRIIGEATGPVRGDALFNAPDPIAVAILAGSKDAAWALMDMGERSENPDTQSYGLLACAQSERFALFQALIEANEKARGVSEGQALAFDEGVSHAAAFIRAKSATQAPCQEGQWSDWERWIERAELLSAMRSSSAPPSAPGLLSDAQRPGSSALRL